MYQIKRIENIYKVIQQKLKGDLNINELQEKTRFIQ